MGELNLYERAVPSGRRDSQWRDVVTRDRDGSVDIALVGKYGLEDAYLSVHEALKHAGLEKRVAVNREWIHSEDLADGHDDQLEDVEGVVVPGGFGARGTEGKIEAVRYARENDVPFLGLCLGFQMAVVEFARHELGLEGAHSAELDEDTPHPVIDLLPEQRDLEDMGGTMRLGTHVTEIKDDTLASELYGADSCTERHRHRYEVNPEYIADLEAAGMVFSGRSGNRMELLELPDHPFFLGTQFHPEFRSRPTRASPLFVGLIDAVMALQGTTDAGEPARAGGDD